MTSNSPWHFIVTKKADLEHENNKLERENEMLKAGHLTTVELLLGKEVKLLRESLHEKSMQVDSLLFEAKLERQRADRLERMLIGLQNGLRELAIDSESELLENF